MDHTSSNCRLLVGLEVFTSSIVARHFPELLVFGPPAESECLLQF